MRPSELFRLCKDVMELREDAIVQRVAHVVMENLSTSGSSAEWQAEVDAKFDKMGQAIIAIYGRIQAMFPGRQAGPLRPGEMAADERRMMESVQR